MAKSKKSLLSSITLVDEKNLRGILAPPKVLSREMLEDILDLIGYAKPRVVKRLNREFKSVPAKKLIDGEELRKSLKL